MSEYSDWCDPIHGGNPERASDVISELYRDIMTLAGRLVFEDEYTFAPETREVMSRWRDEVIKQLSEPHSG